MHVGLIIIIHVITLFHVIFYCSHFTDPVPCMLNYILADFLFLFLILTNNCLSKVDVFGLKAH